MIKKCVDVFIGYVYKNTEENEMYVINDIFYEKITLRKLPGWGDWKEYQYSEFKELIDKGIYKFETVHYTYFPLSVGDEWTLEKDTKLDQQVTFPDGTVVEKIKIRKSKKNKGKIASVFHRKPAIKLPNFTITTLYNIKFPLYNIPVWENISTES